MMSKETIQQLIERHVIDNSGQWNHGTDEAWILVGQGRFKVTREEFNAAADRLRGKPNFNDHPYAKYLAQNEDGSWHKYSGDDAPTASDGGWGVNNSTHRGGFTFICNGKVIGDWRNTLEKRPEQQSGEPSVDGGNAGSELRKLNAGLSKLNDGDWFEAGELPPVGSTELDCKIKGKAYEQIKAFKVLAHENGKAVIASYHNERERWAEIESYYKRPVNFTPYVISKPYFLPIDPIKTDKEKAIETAKELIKAFDIPPAAYGALYDAGLLRLPDQK